MRMRVKLRYQTVQLVGQCLYVYQSSVIAAVKRYFVAGNFHFLYFAVSNHQQIGHCISKVYHGYITFARRRNQHFALFAIHHGTQAYIAEREVIDLNRTRFSIHALHPADVEHLSMTGYLANTSFNSTKIVHRLNFYLHLWSKKYQNLLRPMKKTTLLCLLIVALPVTLFSQPYLKGKVKVVNSLADYKVRVVNAFPDLKVQIVNTTPHHDGQWQMVTALEDFSIQFVDAFEDFTIQYVDAFPGPTKKNNASPAVSSQSNAQTVSESSTSSSTVVVSSWPNRRVLPNSEYGVVVEEDSFSIPRRLPGRKFPIHARVQLVDSLPDLLLRHSPQAFPNFRITIDSVASSKKFHWQLVDSCPDFTIQFYDYHRFTDASIEVENYEEDAVIHAIILENERECKRRFPDPEKEAPLPDCKPLKHIY